MFGNRIRIQKKRWVTNTNDHFGGEVFPEYIWVRCGCSTARWQCGATVRESSFHPHWREEDMDWEILRPPAWPWGGRHARGCMSYLKVEMSGTLLNITHFCCYEYERKSCKNLVKKWPLLSLQTHLEMSWTLIKNAESCPEKCFMQNIMMSQLNWPLTFWI